MSEYVWGDKETQYFFALSPEVILKNIDQIGFKSTGRCLILNSLENRVYEIEVDRPEDQIKTVSDNFIVAKFYRPGRWSPEQILEEHQFMLEASEAEIPVIPPIAIDGKTLFSLDDQSLYFAIFPKKGGRIPDEMTDEQLEIQGRNLARLHNIGETKNYKHRLTINCETFGLMNLNYLLDKKIIPQHLIESYQKIVLEICQLSNPLFKGIKNIRIHGDCHLGNIISRESEGLFLIDFDDTLTGPAVQDIWLCTPGDDLYSKQNREILLEAYTSMRNFNRQELKLVDSLRALRFIHFSAWIAKRWEDPAFKNVFGHYGTESYWQIQIADLNEQLQKIRNII